MEIFWVFVWWFQKKSANLPHQNERKQNKHEINLKEYVLYDAGNFRRETIVDYVFSYI
ncbi:MULTISPECIES: hypothetical protein [Flavobacterium]|uniref:Uncharacterized protein n=1 Tax=Flavobacterium cupriresistens TaxID=2893885 RepID=A0ABU4RE07_9FLAO|nr:MULTISPECIES: hypothetical protein [unclassified Flavobacterium]MDX6190814.1 hypothetical protein [Flavobacterium sp. Fl-318]UFH44013.1 hypothetical protein LNP23_07280 [Flavobacterium sp. F-323]